MPLGRARQRSWLPSPQSSAEGAVGRWCYHPVACIRAYAVVGPTNLNVALQAFPSLSLGVIAARRPWSPVPSGRRPARRKRAARRARRKLDRGASFAWWRAPSPGAHEPASESAARRGVPDRRRRRSKPQLRADRRPLARIVARTARLNASRLTARELRACAYGPLAAWYSISRLPFPHGSEGTVPALTGEAHPASLDLPVHPARH